MHGKFNGFFIIKQTKKPGCLGSGWSTQEVGKNTQLRLVFPLHFFHTLAATCMLNNNRTEVIQPFQGVFICEIMLKIKIVM